MTLAEAGEIFRYWHDHPPAHVMLQSIARVLGWRPPAAALAENSVAALAAAPPPGLVVARSGSVAMPAPLLDAAALRERNRARARARRNENRHG
ncbi:MAG TPA: hypothetical protein VME41_03165 [Stellaceae bacterium]|nr:hypothetical protein [Stellaceae bacterium]